MAAFVTLPVAACEDSTPTVPDFELPESTPFEAGVSTPPSRRPDAGSPPTETDAAPDAEPDAAPVCDDGTVEGDETCDPLGTCPTSCPPVGCEIRTLENGGTCKARCVTVAMQTACANGDGCCPPGCNATNDDDCLATCDNGVIEQGETCDPLASCPTTCEPIGCQLRTLENAGTCKAECVNAGKITECKSGDGCCPDGCNANDDTDCAAGCGNNVVEPGETCDPLETCPTKCPPIGCQHRKLVNGGTCQAECVDDFVQTACINDDGCCPDGCNANNDNDCKPACDNGVIEKGETCDPLASCPTSCEQKGCTLFTLENAGTCRAECVKAGEQDKCIHGDGCCPAGCSAANDNDCKAECGNGVVEPGETCDPKLPGSCEICDQPLYTCLRNVGSPSTCDVQCKVPIDKCQGTLTRPDGCCPYDASGGCNVKNDPDCKGPEWRYVKIADFDSTDLSGRSPCRTLRVDQIEEGGSYLITTCAPTKAEEGSGDTEIMRVRTLDSAGGETVYTLAKNDDCTDSTALPHLAGWSCRSTSIGVPPFAMSCATPSPGGFKLQNKPVVLEVSICAASKEQKEVPPQSFGRAPVYIWYNASVTPRLAPAPEK